MVNRLPPSPLFPKSKRFPQVLERGLARPPEDCPTVMVKVRVIPSGLDWETVMDVFADS